MAEQTAAQTISPQAAEQRLPLSVAGRQVRRTQILRRILRHRGAVAGFVVLGIDICVVASVFAGSTEAPLLGPFAARAEQLACQTIDRR